jgi:hypothetical protein
MLRSVAIEYDGFMTGVTYSYDASLIMHQAWKSVSHACRQHVTLILS